MAQAEQDLPPSVVGQTYHSILETCVHGNSVAVIKRCRHVENPRTFVRWKNEVECLKIAGTHDNITSLLASDATTLSLVLRLEPGASLDTYIDASQRHCTLSRDAGTLVLRQMASALSHLHSLRLVHDDVKPDNILWDPRASRAVLVDFGAALDFHSTVLLPRDDWDFNPSGTPSYAPPEFLDRKKGRGGEGDVWALGIVMLFVWGRVGLPDGEWFLPGVWDEGGDTEMRRWLAEVNRMGQAERDEGSVLGEMLYDNPVQRIRSVDLVQRLLE